MQGRIAPGERTDQKTIAIKGVCLVQAPAIFKESSILAQDERWRRA